MYCCNIIKDVVYFRIFILEKWFKMLKEDSMQIPSQRSRIPSFCPDSPDIRPDAHQCLEDSNSSRLHLSGRHGNTSGAHQSSTWNQISFIDTNMGRQLHPSGRKGNTIWTLSLIRQDVKKNCNHPDVRATQSERSPYYGIYVQQKCNRPDCCEFYITRKCMNRLQ